MKAGSWRCYEVHSLLFLKTGEVIWGQPQGFSGPVSCFLVLSKSDISCWDWLAEIQSPLICMISGVYAHCFFQGLPCAWICILTMEDWAEESIVEGGRQMHFWFIGKLWHCLQIPMDVSMVYIFCTMVACYMLTTHKKVRRARLFMMSSLWALLFFS